MLSWDNLCSQCAFILCPVTLSTIYTYSHEGSFYASILFVVVALIAISLMMSMKNAYELGRPRKVELPVVQVEIPNTEVEEKKVEVPNTDVEKVEVPNTEVEKVEIPNTEVEKVEIPNTEVEKVEIPNTEVGNNKEQSNIQMNEVNKTTAPCPDTKEEMVQNDAHPNL